MEEKIVKVLNEMSAYLTIAQMKKLQEIMLDTFAENKIEKSNVANNDFLQMFLDAKKIEGCSGRTIQYYQTTILHMFSKMNVPIRKITTEEIRAYLSEYQENSHCTNVTVDNIRRNISSFFSWLEEEDYILKSPMKRIHKIKTKTVVKSVISDEGIEKLRDYCTESRDLAIIDLLYSTGIRVGELVNLNIDDIDLEGRECVVYGKGNKERRVYFDAKAKVGRCYIVQSDDEFYFQDGMITWLSNYDRRITALYISYLFEMPGFRKQIDALQAGSTVAYMSISMTKKLNIIVPPIELQNQFADFVKQVDKSKVIKLSN